jgi:hypothetical protein
MVPLLAGGLNKEALRVSAESKGTKDSLNEDNFEGNKKKNKSHDSTKKIITSKKKSTGKK